MQEEIRDYARMGFVHHMLYPECMDDAEAHMRTLEAFVQRDDMETFDCCLPYGEARRERLIPVVRDSGKEHIAFATHLFPLRKIGLSSRAPHEQAQIRMIVKDMIECAAAVGATGMIFASGGPAPGDAIPADYEAFADFCHWLCTELRPHGITALLEPFDTTIDKKFLYGPTAECMALIESLTPKIDNFGIELDLAHVPLMFETFEDAIRTVAPALRRVHLGNCVLKDASHPRYGDTHPPIGYEGGEIDVPEVAEILRCLLGVGFLSKESRGDLLIEMTPWPGRTVDETIADTTDRLARAWAMV